MVNPGHRCLIQHLFHLASRNNAHLAEFSESLLGSDLHSFYRDESFESELRTAMIQIDHAAAELEVALRRVGL